MIEFHVPGISCGHCVGAVTQAVLQVDPKAQVRVDLPTKQVLLESGEDRKLFATALADAGYPPDA